MQPAMFWSKNMIKTFYNSLNKLNKQTQKQQTGSVTIYLTVLGTLFLATIFGTTIFLQTILGSYKAAHAADLAALAAADTLREITTGEPCDIAKQIVESFGAVMVSCQLLDDSVIVATSFAVWNEKFWVSGLSKAGEP